GPEALGPLEPSEPRLKVGVTEECRGVVSDKPAVRGKLLAKLVERDNRRRIGTLGIQQDGYGKLFEKALCLGRVLVETVRQKPIGHGVPLLAKGQPARQHADMAQRQLRVEFLRLTQLFDRLTIQRREFPGILGRSRLDVIAMEQDHRE